MRRLVKVVSLYIYKYLDFHMKQTVDFDMKVKRKNKLSQMFVYYIDQK